MPGWEEAAVSDCICLPAHLAEGAYDAGCPVHDVACGFEWTDGWGSHRCLVHGEHRVHHCACDQEQVAVLVDRGTSGWAKEDRVTPTVDAAAAFEESRDWDGHEARWGAGAPRKEDL